MHLYWRLLNEKSSCTHFLIKVLLITVIFQSQDMASFFDILAAYECFWGCPFTLAHTKMFIISHPNCDYTGIPVNIDLTNDVYVSLHFDAMS